MMSVTPAVDLLRATVWFCTWLALRHRTCTRRNTVSPKTTCNSSSRGKSCRVTCRCRCGRMSGCSSCEARSAVPCSVCLVFFAQDCHLHSGSVIQVIVERATGGVLAFPPKAHVATGRSSDTQRSSMPVSSPRTTSSRTVTLPFKGPGLGGESYRMDVDMYSSIDEVKRTIAVRERCSAPSS